VPEPDHRNTPIAGIGLMIAGLALLTLNDAVAKWLAADYPTGQIIAIRSPFILVPVLFLTTIRGGFRALLPYSFKNQALRALCFIGSTFFIITALGLMPLADAVAFTFAAPLFISALAGPLLGERVGWRRWSAVLVGFAGVVIMARPTPDAFQWTAFVALGAAFFGALRDIVTRKISAVESSNLILLYSTAAVGLAGCASAAVVPWRVPDLNDIGLFALLGVLNGGAHFLMIESFSRAEASIVSPFRYTALVWAVIFGYLVWGDLPDAWLLAGAALVVASGLYIFHRETRAR
jgi:drug/metabolite transporter (DMT)-like permease